MKMDADDGLMESILLIPAEFKKCPFAPIYKIERRLTHEQARQYIERDKAVCKALDIDHAPEIDIQTQVLWRKDIYALSRMITAVFMETAALLNLTAKSERLYQAIEIDWTLNDLHSVEYPIHYEIFTKRELIVRQEVSDKVANG